jgi:hypothetical protein
MSSRYPLNRSLENTIKIGVIFSDVQLFTPSIKVVQVLGFYFTGCKAALLSEKVSPKRSGPRVGSVFFKATD